MYKGQAVMDKAGEKNKNLELDSILNKFYEIGIEVGDSI